VHEKSTYTRRELNENEEKCLNGEGEGERERDREREGTAE